MFDYILDLAQGKLSLEESASFLESSIQRWQN
ncbi:hypothetical protein JOF45_000087 [Nesterenkonia lacusekhoensis]|uniref:Uncharacterized protein n=1 Tax=Nesterenkonia lacusekhoensis TaxID=150832 RepID=A0ABS4SY54_9MICC|nr:hypothetical protein [Nesterenkonia lacusekhoensis]